MKAVIAWMLLCCCLLGQERSVVEILSEQGDLPMGRATIVSEDGKAITAYHVVIDNPQLKLGDIKIRDRDGTIRRGAKFVKGQKDNDLALIQIPVWDGMEPVEIGEVEGEVMVFDIEWQQQKPKLSLEQRNHYYFDHRPYQGESGGPVFCNGKLCGVVSGGWFWIEQDLIGTLQRRQTWPLRAPKIPKDFLK